MGLVGLPVLELAHDADGVDRLPRVHGVRVRASRAVRVQSAPRLTAAPWSPVTGGHARAVSEASRGLHDGPRRDSRRLTLSGPRSGGSQEASRLRMAL